MELLSTGKLDGWPYLVMRHVPGIAIGSVWRDLAPEARIDLAQQIGSVTRALHDLSPPANAEPWEPFWDRCRAQALAALERSRHSALALEVNAYLEGTGPLTQGPSALLHTELLDQHILVERTSDSEPPDGPWRVSALIDFADARVGAPEYDLPALAEFIFQDFPRAWQGFYQGYGWHDRQGEPPSPQECLAWTLQHQFTNLSRAVRAAGEPAPSSLTELAERLFRSR